MKKFFKSLALIATIAFGFASCEDVPEPYNLPSVGGNTTEEEIVAKGDGTATNPFNVKGLTEWIAQNEDIAVGKEVYVEGVISSIKSLDVSKYTRAQYYINDTESTVGQFYVYNGLYLDGANFTANDQIKVGDKVLIKGNIDQYNGSFQIGQNSVILKLNEEGEGGGTQTDATPVTCSEAAAIAMTLEDKASTTERYTVTGYITEVVGDVSKNQQTFWMADTKDGGKVFEAFWANLPEGVEKFVKGSKVKITGPITRFGSTAEIKNATVEILEVGEGGEGGGGDQGELGEPKGTGTQADPYNVAAAITYIKTLASGEKPSDLVYTKGKVSEVVKMGTSGSIQFKMSDDGQAANSLLVYYCDNLGKVPFTAATDLKVGDEVIVCGTVQNYQGNTPEYNSGSYLVYLNGKTDGEGGGDGDKGDGDKGDGDKDTGTTDATLLMASLYNITEGSTDAGTITSNGITLTFEKNGGNNEPKYYWNANEAYRAVRMYAKNKMTVNAGKKIDSIKINCAAGSGSTYYNGNSTMTTSAGSLTQNSDNVTVVVTGINATSFEVTNEHTSTSGGVQLRIVSLEVVYAK